MTGFADRKSKSSPTHPYFSHDTLNVEKFASTNFRENKISRGWPLHDRCLQILTNIFLSHGTDKFLMIIRKFDAFDLLPSPPFLFAYPSYCTMVSYKKACKHFTCYYVVTIKHTCNRTCAVIPLFAYLRIWVSLGEYSCELSTPPYTMCRILIAVCVPLLKTIGVFKVWNELD